MQKSLNFSDQFNNRGRIYGGVHHDHLKNFNLDLNLRFNNLHGINTNVLNNPTIYGQAFASGRVQITGPLNGVKLDIDVKTEPNTSIHIPLMNSGKNQSSIISFVSDIKPIVNSYDSLINLRIDKEESRKNNALQVGVKAEVTPDADVTIEINRSTGDAIRGRGVGYININLDGQKLDIKGDYSINEGSYRFGMLSIITRDFTIEPGSKINFVGDVLDSEIDVQAVYKTKASIGAIVNDGTNTSNRRNVNCGIDLSGKLSDLNIDFNIDIPDLDPTSQGIIQTALNSEEKRMKQFLALMVSGNLLPDEQSGINENFNMSLLNTTEILSNQLNTILNELNIPVDLGFNYQTGSTGKNIFDVAISTQLFNNRVSINGNIGNREFLSTSQRSDIIGDIDIEVKLDKTGKVRFNLFSHSADKFSSYLDQSQRNGAGFVIQEDFNTFRELFRNIFWSKKRKAEYESIQSENETEEFENSAPIILKSSKK